MHLLVKYSNVPQIRPHIKAGSLLRPSILGLIHYKDQFLLVLMEVLLAAYIA